MLVLGAGSIGTLFAYDAARRLQGAVPVSLLVRNRSQFPPCIQVENEPKLVAPAEINIVEAKDLQNGKFRIVLFACKQYDLQPLSEMLHVQNCCADVGISLSNGLGAVESVKMGGARFEQTLAAVTYAGAKLVKRGLVYRTATGEAPTVMETPHSSQATSLLSTAIPHLKFATSTEEMQRVIWKKLLANVVINPLTALFNIPNGLVPEVCGEFIPPLIDEFTQVCSIKEWDFGNTPKDKIDFVHSVCKLTSANTSSMLADIQNKRRTEIDALNGSLLLLAQHELPTHKFLVQSIKALELRNKMMIL